ncbi:MAG: hypothetical protein U1E46_18540 [Hyphomicrobiales bacterium]
MPSPVAGQVTKVFREGIRLTRSLMNSSLEATAKKLGPKAVALRKTKIVVPDADGYVKFDTASIAMGRESVAQVARLCKDWVKDPERSKYDKLFPYNLARSADLLDHPAFLKLALHDDVLASVSEYLGQVPRLYNLYMWWTPPNDTAERSQLYHYDHREALLLTSPPLDTGFSPHSSTNRRSGYALLRQGIDFFTQRLESVIFRQKKSTGPGCSRAGSLVGDTSDQPVSPSAKPALNLWANKCYAAQLRALENRSPYSRARVSLRAST